MIYFAQAVSGGDIKIGTTDRWSQRRPNLEGELGFKLVALGIMDGAEPVEKSLHRQFSHLRVRGEWFRPDPELLDFISKETRPWTQTEEDELAQYTGTKIDAEVLRLMRAACALQGVRMQDWLSDLVNEKASDMLGRKPIKRKPPKPKD